MRGSQKQFSVKSIPCYCSDTDHLLEEIGTAHDPSEWLLFIDSSSRSLKCALLHSGNQYTAIPIDHSVHLREDYENVRFLMECIGYKILRWQVCGDFKIIGFLKGLQGGYTKNLLSVIVLIPCIIKERTGLRLSILSIEQKMTSMIHWLNQTKYSCLHCTLN